MTVSGVAVNGSSFSVSGLTAPVTLGVRRSIVFDVTFAPKASGAETGSVSLTCTSGCFSPRIALVGTGIGGSPAASFSAGSLAFGSQSVGTTSTAKSVTLTNAGGAPLGIGRVALTGANSSDFAQTNNCGSSVAAGASCSISVTFTPAAGGSLVAAVSVSDNAGGSPQTVTLSGTGETNNGSPGASLSSSSLSFGDEPVDVPSSSQSITLQNSGSTSLSITSIALGGSDPSDFTENNTCGSSLAAGSSCTIVTSFSPSASGSLSASLTITDNASGSPQSVALSGTGTHDVILSWTANSNSGVEGYYVYRGTTPGGESSTPLNSTPISSATYDDGAVQAGQTYYYKVSTVSTTGTQSAESAETSATVPSS